MSVVDRLASYPLFRLRGDVVDSVHDEYGEITVLDSDEHRVMSFDRLFEQSKMLKTRPAQPVHNYLRAMLMVLAIASPRRALVLGLGGGCLVRALHAHQRDMAIDVVELREAVLLMTQQHFTLPAAPQVHYFIEDAATFVADDRRSGYDAIFADLYDADAMAPAQSQRGFLHDCAARLRPDGWLTLNFPQLPAERTEVMKALRAAFTTLLWLVAPSGNVVIFASKAHVNRQISLLREQAAELGRIWETDFSALAQKLSYLTRDPQRPTLI